MIIHPGMLVINCSLKTTCGHVTTTLSKQCYLSAHKQLLCKISSGQNGMLSVTLNLAHSRGLSGHMHCSTISHPPFPALLSSLPEAFALSCHVCVPVSRGSLAVWRYLCPLKYLHGPTACGEEGRGEEGRGEEGRGEEGEGGGERGEGCMCGPVSWVLLPCKESQS